MEKRNKIYETRETNKISLDTFTFDIHNVLDNPIDKLIEQNIKEVKKEYEDHNKWMEIYENDRNKFDEIEEIAQQTGHSLWIQMHEYISTASYIEDELFALCEMKIIYAFKHLEINIKKLVSSSYSETNTKNLYKWENLVQYLDHKNINISTLEGFKEVNELRIINNNLKHSKNFSNDATAIEEFKNKQQISYIELNQFYSRIKRTPKVFLNSLSTQIYKDLYSFDDDKINNIAKSYTLRMDKKDAIKLAEKIISLYD